MKKSLFLLPAFLLAFNVQAQALDEETEALLDTLEFWVQEVPTENEIMAVPQKSERQSYNTASRWERRQAAFRNLTGQEAQVQKTSSRGFGWRKNRQTRSERTANDNRPRRTMSRSNYGSSSVKARLMKNARTNRGELKPSRFKGRTNQATSQEDNTLNTILEGLEADFDFEIEQ